MDTHEDQQFLETLVKALVDHPEAVETSRSVDEMGVLLTLDVHPDDMGKIIGRSGNTAKAIRTLLRVVGMKHDARVNLKINEPEGGKGTYNSIPEDVMHDAMEPAEVANAESGVARQESTTPKSLDEAIDDLKI